MPDDDWYRTDNRGGLDYEGPESRYALYALRRTNSDPDPETPGYRRLRVCETSLNGIGLALVTMLDEGEIQKGDAVGILDRLERAWLINPFLHL